MNIIDKILKDETFQLSKPVKVGEEEIDTLSLPFSSLRGRDIADAQGEFEALNGGAIEILENSKGFHAYLISRMAKVPYEIVLDDLALHDFSALTLAVYRFLLTGA